MKKTKRKMPAPSVRGVAEDDILPEYDFRGARRNPYARRFGAGVTVVVLEPDVAESFPDAIAVNEALRASAKIARRQPKKPASKRRTA